MNRSTTAVLAALDALITVAIGVGIPAVMLTVLWATQFDLAVDWSLFWRAAADFWMLGNGVDLRLALDAQTAAQLAPAQGTVPFEIGIAPLGFALLTLLFGRRSGLRLGLTPHPVFGAVVGVIVVAALSALIWASAETFGALPSFWQAVLFVPAVYGLGLVAGALESMVRIKSELAATVFRLADGIRSDARSVVALSLRGGAIVALALVAAGALTVTGLLILNYSTVVSLYESLQSGIAGGAALTIAQLAFVPNLAIWAATWLLGPGFAVGAGSSVSPLGTQLGLIPALPVFGALPHSSVIGFVALVVPVAIGFLAGALLHQRLPDPAGYTKPGVGRMLGAGFGSAAVAAIILSLLAMWSGGALGPGRLSEVGPQPLQVLLWSFVVFGVSISAGLLASGRKRSGAPPSEPPPPTSARGTVATEPETTSLPT